nr:hypothetical protein [Pantoea rwandensis]
MSIRFPLHADGLLDAQQAAPRFKSVAGAGNSPLAQGTAVFNSDEVFSPLMIMKQSALENNLRQLAAFCREQGIMLAAHGKTSMSPAVLRRAITEGGAWGLGAATPAQVRALRQLVFAMCFSPMNWSIRQAFAGLRSGSSSILIMASCAMSIHCRE